MVTSLSGTDIEVVDTCERFRVALAKLLAASLSFKAYHSGRKVSVVAIYRKTPWFWGPQAVCELIRQTPNRREASYVFYGTGEREQCDDEKAIKGHPTWQTMLGSGLDIHYVKSLTNPDELLGVLEALLTTDR